MDKSYETFKKQRITTINDEISELSNYKSTSPYVVRLLEGRIGELVIKLSYLVEPCIEEL